VPQKFKHPNFLIKCLNYSSSVSFYSVNQFRAVKCFLEKIAMMGNVIGVPQNMEYVFRVPSVKKRTVENHCSRTWA
jgi:hypothetical protein